VDTRLSVNLNKVALLRNQRDLSYPSVLDSARLVIEAGAHGITVHPRPDERHIRRSDTVELSDLIRTNYLHRIEFNVEGYPSDEFVELVTMTHPDQVTLVPDDPDQRTSDHGWDLARDGGKLAPVIKQLQSQGMRISLFVDPDPEAMVRARDTGADRVELYTEPYATAHAAGNFAEMLDRYARTAQSAQQCGLGVNAGHDLNLDNLPAFKKNVPNLAEVSIGHAITAEALRIGFPGAVRAYLTALQA
jgi:pyridoxine 5-phosphate synthase